MLEYIAPALILSLFLSFHPNHRQPVTKMQLEKLVYLAVGFFLFPYASAQRPANTSICDFYTTALLKDNTAANQLTLLTLLVNTVVIGNYTKPNVGIKVPGILAPGIQDGVPVDLLGFFNGSMKIANRNNQPASVNFLDDGGAAPLKQNMPANTQNSNQYFLLTHLYQFFGKLLGCSKEDTTGFPGYSGINGQFEVHKFMNISKPQMDYFITQVGLAALSFGVSKDDVTIVGNALNSTFGRRCSPPVAVIVEQGEHLEAICINPNCVLATSAVCAQYQVAATATGTTGATGGSSSAPAGGAASSSKPAGTSGGEKLSRNSLVWGLLISSLCLAFGVVM